MVLLIQEDLRIPRQACVVALRRSAQCAQHQVIKQEEDIDHIPTARADNPASEIIDLCTPPPAVQTKQEATESFIAPFQKTSAVIDLTLFDSDNE